MRTINRRTAVKQLSALAAGVAIANHTASASEPTRTTGMGVVVYDFNIRRR
jgi:hypothetical protein